MSNGSRNSFYDYSRIIFAVAVPFLISIETEISWPNKIIGWLIFIYSAVLLFAQRRFPRVRAYSRIYIIIDTILISLPLLLLKNKGVFYFLYILQLIGVTVSYGLREILMIFYIQTGTHIIMDLYAWQDFILKSQFNDFVAIFYFIAVVLILSKAWEKERNANREMVNKLTRKVQNIRDTYEISKILSFPEVNLSIRQILCQITLKDMEIDAGAVLFDEGEGFELEAVVRMSEDFQGLWPAGSDIERFLNELVLRGETLLINDTGNVEINLPYPPVILEIFKKYGSAIIYPYAKNFKSIIVIGFSKQQGYFTEEKIAAYKKTFAKTLFALNRVEDNGFLGEDITQDQQTKLPNLVSAMLVRLFRAEKCIIALFDGDDKITVEGYYGDSHFKTGMRLDHRDEIIYMTKNRNHSSVIDINAPGGIKKFNGIKYENLLCVPFYSGLKISGIIVIINKHDEDFKNYLSFNTEDQLLLISLANQIGLVRENKTLFKEQKETFVTTIRSLVQALDARDPYTKGHSEQVAFYAEIIAKEMGLSNYEMENIRFAALLHDIGKIGIPESVLHKPGSLTPIEYNQIKMHPYISAQILKPVSLFTPLLPFVYHHHERWDGKGYPDGLEGENIPLGARILAVADAFDAMIADRVYRRGKEKDIAINELVKCAAYQFDPTVVDALLTGLEKQLFVEVNSEWKFDSLSNVFRDVLNAVTSGHLVISDDRDITGLKQEGKKLGELIIQKPEEISEARSAVKKILREYNVPGKEVNKILLCVSEAANNMVKHASGGKLSWYLCNDGRIRFIAEDSGPGLKLRDLPKATLVKGSKNKKALGLGFTVLLELLNKVYLKTGEQGTTLILEQKLDSYFPGIEQKTTDNVS